MIRNKRYLFIIFCLLFTLLSGCQTSRKTAKSPNLSDSTSNLVYYTWQDEQAITEKLIKVFHSTHPYIKVEVKYLSNNINSQGLQDLLNSDETVDLIGIKSMNQILDLQQDEQLLNLTAQIRNSSLDIANYGNMYAGISIDGDYYSMPFRSTCWVLVYNKDIFDEVGIPYPSQMTWQEYAALAAQLTTETNGEKQWGGLFVDWLYNFAGIQQLNYLYDDDMTPSQESLELLNQFYNIDKSHLSLSDIPDEDFLSIFEAGKVAMMPQGEWFANMIMADELEGTSSVHWGYAPMPVFDTQKAGTTWGQYQVAAIPNKSKNPEAAFELLKFLCGEEGAEIYANNGFVPAYQNDDVKTTLTKAIGEENADIIFQSHLIQEQPIYSGYTTLQEYFDSEAVKYLNGQQTLEQTMRNFITRRQRFFDEQ